MSISLSGPHRARGHIREAHAFDRLLEPIRGRDSPHWVIGSAARPGVLLQGRAARITLTKIRDNPSLSPLFANDLQLHLSPATRTGLAGRRRLLPETPRPTLAMPARERPSLSIGGLPDAWPHPAFRPHAARTRNRPAHRGTRLRRAIPVVGHACLAHRLSPGTRSRQRLSRHRGRGLPARRRAAGNDTDRRYLLGAGGCGAARDRRALSA